jgi:hypothetical protein
LVNLAVQRFDSQNVSSSAIKMTGGPPDEIFTVLAKFSFPPGDSAHLKRLHGWELHLR